MSSPSAAWPEGRTQGLVDRMRASFRQRSIDRVGRRTTIAGRPHVESDGVIQIGADCFISSHPVQSHFVVMQDARLCIGDHVLISYGAAISARSSVQIGDNTRIGPFCLLMDNDFHRVGDRDSPGGVAPLEIGRNVVLGARVTVLRGARIGDGACVMSGSTVAGVIPSGAVVTGVPARVGGDDSGRFVARAVASLFMRVFRLAAPPSPLDGSGRFAGWTDGGSIRLLLALEEEFGILLPEDQVRTAASVADITRLVIQVRERNLRGPARG